jgi:hypothetical protein
VQSPQSSDSNGSAARQAPAVSVVVPLYQKAATLPRCLASIQRQSFTDFELLVVDDGSSDEGPRIAENAARKDTRVRVLRRPNGGPGAAKNTGLREASASLIAFLDADDEWEPQFLASAVRGLETHPECAVYASAFRIGPSGVDRWDELRRHGVREGVWRLQPDTGDRELALCLGAIHSCSSLFRTSIVRRFGGFYEENRCRFGEDVYLWLQLMLHYPFLRSFEVSAWYHTDASDLGLSSGRRDLPLEPVFTNPGPIRSACPRGLLDPLERWLALHALRAIHLYADLGDREKVAFLVSAFPRVKRERRQLASAWLKLRAPRLSRWLRSSIKRLDLPRATGVAE